MNTSRAALTSLALLTLLPSVASAEGFMRTQTCYRSDPDPSWICDVDEIAKDVSWLPRTVEYLIDVKGGDDFTSTSAGPPANIIDAIDAGFSVWSDVSCSEFSLKNGGVVDVDAEIAANSDCGASNLRICAKDRRNHVVWVEDWQYSRTIYALTSTTFSVSTGEISDADIEINDDQWTFATNMDPNSVDLQNTIAHEAGHFIGFDHNDDPTSTMYNTASNFETLKRSLEALDEAGMCEAYPPLTDAERAALEDELRQRAGEDEGCCATTPGEPRRAPLGAAVLALALAFTARRRRS